MTRTHRSLLLVLVLAMGAICAPSLFTQDEYIYANNASKTLSPYVYKIDVSPGPSAGKIVQTYTNLSGINGRGVAVVGTTMYYTALSSTCVFSYNLGLQIDNGCLFNVTDPSGKAVTGLGSLAYDGANLWIQELYGGSVGSVFEYTTIGTYVTTVKLAKCSGATTPCDGLEYVNSPIASCTGNLLIANRGDAVDPYDAYTTSGGASCHTAFITPANRNSGIAWDGTFFYTSALLTKQLEVFTGAGVAQPIITLSGAPPGFPPVIDDLSAVYCQGINAWTINFGFAVSNAITAAPPVSTKLDFVYWDSSTTDILTTVDMQIGTTSFGGTPQTSAVQDMGSLGSNCLGFALHKARISFPSISTHAGFVTLSNACSTAGACSGGTPIYWDQSSGPPTAYSNGGGPASCATGSCPVNPIPPETFQF